MDPDANLAELLELAQRIDEDLMPTSREANQLARMVLELDTWLAAGGFLPARWRSEQPPPGYEPVGGGPKPTS